MGSTVLLHYYDDALLLLLLLLAVYFLKEIAKQYEGIPRNPDSSWGNYWPQKGVNYRNAKCSDAGPGVICREIDGIDIIHEM